MVSVYDFGAKGDGFTDDTIAIQAALDSEEDVHFPYGNYKISSSLVTKDRNMIISGVILERSKKGK